MDLRIPRFFFQISQPVNLLGGILLYILGVGIARYLGEAMDWAILVLGQAWVTSFQLGFHFLVAYFTLPTTPGDLTRIPLQESDSNSPASVRRDFILLTAFGGFAAAASLTLLMISSRSGSGAVLILIGLIFLGAILYCVPPFRFMTAGYGELILSITIANLFPALGFLLQHGKLHRLVTMSTFPLTMLYLAMLLATQLPRYHLDVKTKRETLMIRLGWERGMRFHNLLILSAFLLIGIAMLFGLPSPVALPVFFVLPLGLFQIWYMTRIAVGAKPNWQVMSMTAILTFGLTAYLLTFSFWVR